jgi:hypothetical protein
MDDERYTTNFSMLFFSLSSAESQKQKKKQHAQPNQLPRPPTRLLLDLSQNLGILEQEVFLTTNQPTNNNKKKKNISQSIRVKNTLGMNHKTNAPPRPT